MSRHIFGATVVVAAFCAALLFSTTNASAQAIITKEGGSFTQSGALYCAETGWVNWSGPITWKLHRTVDGNGGVHYHVSYDFTKVDGVDAQGNKYQGSGRQSNQFNDPTGDSFEQTYSYSYRLVGKNGLGITCSGTYRLVRTANGDVVLEVNEPTTCECK